MASEFDRADHGRLTESESHAQTLDVARAPEQPLELLLHGRFIYLDDDSDGKVYIRFNDAHSHRFPVRAGAVYKNIVFNRVFLDWDAQPGKRVNIVYGMDASFSPTNDIQNIGVVGKLQALPDDYRRMSVYQKHFAEQSYLGPGGAGLYNHIQLFNPAGSGVKLAVHRVAASSDTAGRLLFCHYNAAFAVLVGFADNKYLTGAASSAEIRQRVGTIQGIYVGQLHNAASVPVEIVKGAPLIVPEGRGVHVITAADNLALATTFEFEEF